MKTAQEPEYIIYILKRHRKLMYWTGHGWDMDKRKALRYDKPNYAKHVLNTTLNKPWYRKDLPMVIPVARKVSPIVAEMVKSDRDGVTSTTSSPDSERVNVVGGGRSKVTKNQP